MMDNIVAYFFKFNCEWSREHILRISKHLSKLWAKRVIPMVTFLTPLAWNSIWLAIWFIKKRELKLPQCTPSMKRLWGWSRGLALVWGQFILDVPNFKKKNWWTFLNVWSKTFWYIFFVHGVYLNFIHSTTIIIGL